MQWLWPLPLLAYHLYMITVKPFKAIRPTRDKAYLVASRSYVSYSDESLEWKLNGNPFTFLHIINPDFADKKPSKGKARYKKVKQRFEQFKAAGYFVEEEKPAFYVYQQQAENHVFTGIIAAVSVDDYLEGRVKVHEHTLTSREEMFTDYLDVTGFNAEPVLLMHKPLASIGALKNRYMERRAEYEFTSTDKTLHLLWPVTEQADVQEIETAFKNIEALYIADGHHRCASSVRLAQKRGGATQAAHQYFLSFLMPETTVRLHEFNRLVKNLNGLSTAEFLAALEKKFFVHEIEKGHFKPTSLHEVGMYMHGKWFSLFSRPGTYNPEDAVQSLDCQILSDNILSPILGIEDLRTDTRIGFLPGNVGHKGLQQAIDSGAYEVGFSLFPVSIEQLKRVADEGQIMPPKSTYIEPKLRSGLIIYNLNEK